MFDRFQDRWRTFIARARRVERRELREFRAWLENTRNLVHISVLLFVPLLIGLVTMLSNTVGALPFLMFPPLASGTYTLFANPESRHASFRRFVGGLTAGAVCGYLALEVVARYWYHVDPIALPVHAGAAALSVFLTALVTWMLDLEVSQAFSTALLVLVTPNLSGQGARPFEYVVSVFLAAVIVASVFTVWKDRFYERRARYLYESTKGDDHVLVPMRGDHPDETAMLAGRLAGAHDAGKVVLLDIVDDETIAEAERTLIERDDPAAAAAPPQGDSDAEADLAERAEEQAAADAAAHLEGQASRIETKVGVPCEVIVAVDGDDPAKTVLQTAHQTNCDLIVTPYEESHGGLSQYVRDLFRGDIDVLVHRSVGDRTRWKRILVPVRRASDVAHTMLDFACRLANSTGRISVCHCINSGGDRRDAEDMLANLVETFTGNVETRVSESTIEQFLENNASHFDLVIIGASTDRSAASRFISPPTFERIQNLDADVAILDRNF